MASLAKSELFSRKKTASSFAILLVAAGNSSRLGQPKQLVKINNQSLLFRQCQLALSLSETVVCVLGAQYETIKPVVSDLPIAIVKNTQWQLGMGSSIAAGIEALSPNIEAAMILLVDQWQLTVADIERCRNTWLRYPDKIVTACSENSKNGPPVIFPRKYFSELRQLREEQGARRLIQTYQDAVVPVQVNRAFTDLDTPEQLQMLRAHHPQ